jgi:hypothetical protein
MNIQEYNEVWLLEDVMLAIERVKKLVAENNLKTISDFYKPDY